MIFLRDNVRLDRDLTHDDIKPRLLGEIPVADTVEAIANGTRSLGNMSRINLDILAPELLYSETSFGHALCGWTGAWSAGYSSFPVD